MATGFPSTHLNTRSLPAYMRKRVNISGPNTGFPLIFSGGPKSVTGSSAVRIASVNLPFRVVPVVFGWTAASCVTGTCTLGLGGSLNNAAYYGTVGGSWLGGSAPSLVGTGPVGGTYYRDDTGSSNYLLRQTSATVAGATDPDSGYANTVNATYVNKFTVVLTQGSSNVMTDFCWYLLCWPTEHINATYDTTDARIIVAQHPEWD